MSNRGCGGGPQESVDQPGRTMADFTCETATRTPFCPGQAGPLWQSIDCDVGLKSRRGSDMRQDSPEKHDRRYSAAAEPWLPTFALALVPLAGLGALALWLPPEVVLPAVCVVALVAAIVVAAVAFAMPATARPAPVTAWDVAGALTLIGCAAAILGEIEPLIEFLKPLPERSPSRG